MSSSYLIHYIAEPQTTNRSSSPLARSSSYCLQSFSSHSLPAMLFTTVLLAFAAAGPVFSAAVPSTQDVSSEKVSWPFVSLKLYIQGSFAKRLANEDTVLPRADVLPNSARALEENTSTFGDICDDPEAPGCPVKEPPVEWSWPFGW